MSQAPWSRAADPAKTTSVRLRKCGEIWALRRESCRDLATTVCAPRPAPAVPVRHEPAGHGSSRREQSTQTGAHGPGVRPGSPCQQATETRAFRTRRGRRTPRGPVLERRETGRPDPRRDAERPGCRSRSCTSSHDVRLLHEAASCPADSRFTSACDAEHEAAGMCSQCAQRSVRRAPSPGKRAGGRSVSYPRSDLNRHWGPF